MKVPHNCGVCFISKYKPKNSHSYLWKTLESQIKIIITEFCLSLPSESACACYRGRQEDEILAPEDINGFA